MEKSIAICDDAIKPLIDWTGGYHSSRVPEKLNDRLLVATVETAREILIPLGNMELPSDTKMGYIEGILKRKDLPPHHGPPQGDMLEMSWYKEVWNEATKVYNGLGGYMFLRVFHHCGEATRTMSPIIETNFMHYVLFGNSGVNHMRGPKMCIVRHHYPERASARIALFLIHNTQEQHDKILNKELW